MSVATVIPALLAAVLALLGGVHVYWAVGGRRGIRAAIPEVSGRAIFAPPAWVTGLVACGLFLAAFVALSRGQLLFPSPPGSVLHWTALCLAALFLLRSIGDFRAVGFFKRIRGSAFARWDDRLFSPLCVAIGLGFLVVASL